jgi:hypothetical protein
VQLLSAVILKAASSTEYHDAIMKADGSGPDGDKGLVVQ